SLRNRCLEKAPLMMKKFSDKEKKPSSSRKTRTRESGAGEPPAVSAAVASRGLSLTVWSAEAWCRLMLRRFLVKDLAMDVAGEFQSTSGQRRDVSLPILQDFQPLVQGFLSFKEHLLPILDCRQRLECGAALPRPSLIRAFQVVQHLRLPF